MNWPRSSIVSAPALFRYTVPIPMYNGYYGLSSVAVQQSWADIRIDVMNAAISAFHTTVAATVIAPNARIRAGNPGKKAESRICFQFAR